MFTFENRPGAGGTIGARYLVSNPGINVMVWTSSWFVRPLFYPKESYDLANYKVVMIQCTNFPYAILSKKYTSFNDLKKEKRLTMGTIPGSAAESLVHELRRQLPSTELDFIPYNSMTKPRLDVLGGQIDLNVDLASDAVQWVNSGGLNVIGVSGPNSHGAFKSFRSQGIKGFDELDSNFFIVAPKDLDANTTAELSEIFSRVNTNPQMIKLFNDDFCKPVSLDPTQTTALYNQWIKNWETVIRNINYNK